MKYAVAVIMDVQAMNPKLRSDFFSRSKSFIPSESPMPMIGPMSGEMSIAPMITAVEFTFSPREATSVAKIRIHRLVPRNITPRLMHSTTSCCGALSSAKSNLSRIVAARCASQR